MQFKAGQRWYWQYKSSEYDCQTIVEIRRDNLENSWIRVKVVQVIKSNDKRDIIDHEYSIYFNQSNFKSDTEYSSSVDGTLIYLQGQDNL
jgi:hypothetical protein